MLSPDFEMYFSSLTIIWVRKLEPFAFLFLAF